MDGQPSSRNEFKFTNIVSHTVPLSLRHGSVVAGSVTATIACIYYTAFVAIVCLSGWCGAYYANAHYAHTRNGRGVVGIKLGHVQINQFWRWNILF